MRSSQAEPKARAYLLNQRPFLSQQMTASSGSLREGVEGTAGLTLTFPAFTWLPVTALTFSGLPWDFLLLRTPVQIPLPMLGSSQLPGTPALESQCPLCASADTWHTYTQIKVMKAASGEERNAPLDQNTLRIP